MIALFHVVSHLFKYFNFTDGGEEKWLIRPTAGKNRGKIGKTHLAEVSRPECHLSLIICIKINTSKRAFRFSDGSHN